MIPKAVIQNHADACATCPTPCALQRDANAHADPCASCPLARPRWGQWDCKPGAGDRLASQIERRILSPIEKAIPAAAPLVRIVRKCGGCAAARRSLNGNAEGSEI